MNKRFKTSVTDEKLTLKRSSKGRLFEIIVLALFVFFLSCILIADFNESTILGLSLLLF